MRSAARCGCGFRANALKTVDHRGGFDAFLLKAKDGELSPRVLELKRQVVKKRRGGVAHRVPAGRDSKPI